MDPEQRKRMNDALSDQKTIEQLSSSGRHAQQKRREAMEKKEQREREQREREQREREAAAATQK